MARDQDLWGKWLDLFGSQEEVARAARALLEVASEAAVWPPQRDRVYPYSAWARKFWKNASVSTEVPDSLAVAAAQFEVMREVIKEQSIQLTKPSPSVIEVRLVDSLFLPGSGDGISLHLPKDKSAISEELVVEIPESMVSSQEVVNEARRRLLDLLDRHFQELESISNSLPASSPVVLVGSYREISRMFERNLRRTLKFLRTLSPSRPLTVLWGGISRQITSTSVKATSHIWRTGIVTMDTYSVPLAVMISIFLLDFVGSHPMLKAASLGILVMLAPVSKAIVRKTGLPFFPLKETLTGIKFNLGLRGYSDMGAESRRVAFRKVILRIADKNRIFGVVLGYFLIYDRSIGVVVKKRTSDWSGFLHLFNPNQQPSVLEPL